MRRREFIAGAGALAAGQPLMASAQQGALPVVGFVNPTSPAGYPEVIDAFRAGLQDEGFAEGRNVAIEYRWAEGRMDRLPDLFADLARRRVNVVVATGGDTVALAAKSATSTIPVVFNSASDPVRVGLVESLNRPGGNLTGVSRVTTELLPKRLQMLVETAPSAATIAFLVNPANQTIAPRIRDVENAAKALKRTIHLVKADTASAIDAAIGGLAQSGAGALLIANDSFFNARAEQLGALSLRHRAAAIYQGRKFAAAGGLFSYGASLAAAYRTMGVYTGRILKGDKPASLAVQQQSKVDFVVNLKTAKTLGLSIPLPLMGLADEVIE